jgi:putative flippase GtrA
MDPLTRLRASVLRFREGWRPGALGAKAISFALVGLINTVVDYGVFLAARAALARSITAPSLFDWVSASCRCANSTTVSLIAANMISWTVAVTGSYILNSSITFATESGRKLRWRDYRVFIASGIFGWLANTATLVFAAQGLMLPVWLAKALAILASFVVNFLLSYFVVFRARRPVFGAHEDV